MMAEKGIKQVGQATSQERGIISNVMLRAKWWTGATAGSEAVGYPKHTGWSRYF